MTPEAQTVVFLHGIGAGPDSWNAQIDALPEGFTGIAPTIAGLSDADDQEFSLTTAAAAVQDELDRRGIRRAHLCGLSLGGMVATRFAIDYPERVASLVLSGSQVHPNPALMKVQNAIMRILPARVVAQPGMSKQRMLAVLRAVGQTDFRALIRKWWKSCAKAIHPVTVRDLPCFSPVYPVPVSPPLPMPCALN